MVRIDADHSVYCRMILESTLTDVVCRADGDDDDDTTSERVGTSRNQSLIIATSSTSTRITVGVEAAPELVRIFHEIRLEF